MKILKAVTKKLERISPKATEMAEPKIGKKCAVIGGGNVAMDVCRTAIRLGADDTYIIYRRSQAEMPVTETLLFNWGTVMPLFVLT